MMKTYLVGGELTNAALEGAVSELMLFEAGRVGGGVGALNAL